MGKQAGYIDYVVCKNLKKYIYICTYIVITHRNGVWIKTMSCTSMEWNMENPYIHDIVYIILFSNNYYITWLHNMAIKNLVMYVKVILALRMTKASSRGLASTPGSFRTRKESLVHTVCACAKIPRNPGNL